MKNLLNKLLVFIPNKDLFKHYASYIVVGTIVFCVGLVWHFPMDGIIHKILSEVQKQSGVVIGADSFRFSFPVGIKGKNVNISSIPVAALAKTGVQLETLSIHVSPLSLITYPLNKSARVSLSGKQQLMSFSSTAKINPTTITLKGSAKGLNMDHDLYLPSAGANLSIQGLLNVQFNMLSNLAALQKNDLSSIEGSLKATLKKAVLTPPLMGPLNFDQINLDSEAEKSKIVVKSLKMDGPILAGTLNGYIDLRPVLERSIAKLDGKVQMNQKEPTATGLIGLLDLFHIPLDASGKGAFKVTGPLNALVLSSY